ncbi:helix-turn-helix domain-containing protein, partial [Mycobacterium tuberculosis]
MEPDRWYTKTQVAEYLNMSTKTVERRIADGHIVASKFGQAVRINGRSVLEYVERMRVEPSDA